MTNQPRPDAARCCLETPIGILQITESEKGVTGVEFLREDAEILSGSQGRFLPAARQQLAEYFSGKRTEFDLPLDLRGTEFQRKVWAALLTIPYGETRCYQEIAAQAGNPKASRAVGLANNRNPICIIVPCHRVVGKNKKLVGYAGGLWRKEFLLDLEQNTRSRR